MTQRFICPHCHSPLDPYSMEQASSRDAQLRVCPNCDEPVVLQPLATAAALGTLAARSGGTTKPVPRAPSTPR